MRQFAPARKRQIMWAEHKLHNEWPCIWAWRLRSWHLSKAFRQIINVTALWSQTINPFSVFLFEKSGLSLRCLPASGNAGSKGVFLKHPANWMINDFHLSGLLLKNVFTHWLDPKGHRITLLVVIFIFMLCLRSSCSITFHYSGPLAYWKINAFCWPKVVCLRFINWSTGQADIVGGETRANSSAEVAGTKTGLWRVAIRHGYINTVRQGPRIERRAESA